MSNALKSVYPEIKWDHTKFKYTHESMLKLVFNETMSFFLCAFAEWNNQKRKQFFENFAQQNKFDPLNPENWYNVKPMTLWRSGKVLKQIIFL